MRDGSDVGEHLLDDLWCGLGTRVGLLVFVVAVLLFGLLLVELVVHLLICHAL